MIPPPAALLVSAQKGGPQAPLQLQETPIKLLSSVVVKVHLEGNQKWGDGNDTHTSGKGEALARWGGLEVGQQETAHSLPGRAGSLPSLSSRSCSQSRWWRSDTWSEG